MRLAEDFFRSKTTWAAIASILTAVAAALQGGVSPWHAAFMALGAALVAFLRDSGAKNSALVAAALEGFGPADGGEVPSSPVTAPVTAPAATP